MEGEWKGYFTEKIEEVVYRTEIMFHFSKVDDTTFKAVSTTFFKVKKNHYDTAVFILTGSFYEKNILLLEEVRAIKDFSSGKGCLQIMKLYYKKGKKHYLLEGEWFINDPTCGDGNGSIKLRKTL